MLAGFVFFSAFREKSAPVSRRGPSGFEATQQSRVGIRGETGVGDNGVTTRAPTGPAGRDVGHPPPRAKTVGKKPRRRRTVRSPFRHRFSRPLLFALTPLLILTALTVLVTYTRLLQGPISLERFVGPIERSISDSLGALSAKVDDVALVLTDDYSFEFRLINLKLLDSSGARVAAAPVASVSLNAGDLMIGNIVPSRVYLIDPNLLVTYRKAGGFSLHVASKLIQEPSLLGEGQATAEQRLPSSSEQIGQRVGANPTQIVKSGSQRINIARLVSNLNARARQGMGHNSQIKEIGVRNATVTLDYEGLKSDWLIAEAAVDLNQGKNGSAISGAARVQSDRGPWVFSFRTVDSELDNVVRLTASARDLVPNSIAQAAPALSLLKTLDMPIALDATMQVTNDGDMEAATLAIELAPGKLHLPSISGTPLQLDSCVFNLSYDGYQERLTIAPSTLRWADSFLTVAGEAIPKIKNGSVDEIWSYQFSSVDGQLAAEEFGVAGVKIDSWQSTGSVSLTKGKLYIDTFALAAAGVDLVAHGELLAGPDQTSTKFDAALTSQDLKIVTAFWPRAFAPKARQMFGRHVQKGHVKSGTFKLVSGGYMNQEAPIGAPDRQRVSLALEVGDLAVRHDYSDQPAYAERALIRLENDVLEVTVPKVALAAGKSGSIDLKTVRISAVDLFGNEPLAEIAFKVRAPVKSALDFAEKAKPELFQNASISTSHVRGLVVGDFKLNAPLNEAADTAIKIVQGQAKVKDFRLSKKLGNYSIRGGAFDIDVSNQAIDAKGDLLINGVGAKIKLQHILGGAMDKQPPLRITTTLDNSDRDQLELDINDIVAGDIPVEITVGVRDGGAPAVHVTADLTSADLLFAEVAWRKPSGRKVRIEFDPVSGDSGRLELQNIQVVGQGIAIEGFAAVGADNILREFYFPDFSVDTVTRLRLQGKQSKNRIWNVKAIGPTYDGREFFKSLFSLGDLSKERPKARNPSKGIDVDARIENVVGSGNETLRKFQIKVSHRNGKLTALNGKAQLEDGKDVAILLKKVDGKRTLFAESNNAGKVFKLIDFYPNMVGGRGRLELDLDGYGAASQTGTLWTENFRILGDPVASEVFAGAEGHKGKRRVTRQVFEFSRLKMPFSVGHDQFVIKKSYLRGPVLGASVSGKMDYRLRRVNLGGSYIPLQGLNSALCGIPLLGEIITGPKCEGVLGITFAVQGSMASPQVIVNPLSMVAPGIFRDIFQLTNPSVKVVPRQQQRPSVPPDRQVRSSSSVTGAGKQDRRAPTDRGALIDGWSSGTRARP